MRAIGSDARIYVGVVAALVFVGIIVYWVDANLRQSLEAGHGEPFLWLEGISVWPSLVLRFTGLVTTIALAFFFKNSE